MLLPEQIRRGCKHTLETNAEILKNKQTKKVELNWNMFVLMDSAEFTAIIPNIPWQAGITGEGGQSICLHSSGGYWSIAQRWKAKLNPVIFLLAPACKGLHFTSWFVFFTPLLLSWLHPSLLHSDQWWYWRFRRSKHFRKWPHAGFVWITDREARFMVELKQPNPSILTHLFSPANLSGRPRSWCVPKLNEKSIRAQSNKRADWWKKQELLCSMTTMTCLQCIVCIELG